MLDGFPDAIMASFPDRAFALEFFRNTTGGDYVPEDDEQVEVVGNGKGKAKAV